MRNKKVLFIVQAALIAAIYVALTYLVDMSYYEYNEYCICLYRLCS